MTRFADRTAVVTGAGTGIGLATARLLASEGARVVLAGRDRDRGVAAAAAIGGAARFVPVDVTDDASVASLAAEAASDAPIDFWLRNAGWEGPVGGMEGWDDQALSEVIDVNLKSVLSGLRHAAPLMRRGAMFVHTASFVGAYLPVPIAVPYAAAKAGVVAAGRSAAPLLAEAGIAVVTVCPWIVDTPMVDRLTGGAGAQARDGFAAGFAPSGRLTPPEHVAQAIADLWGGTRTADSGAAYLVDHGPTVTELAAPALIGA